MKILLDGIDIFGGDISSLTVGSVERESIERSVAGLDGVVSIDMGQRDRKLVQKGTIGGLNAEQLQQQRAEIESFIDGTCRTLSANDGREFANVRMDSFKAKSFSASSTEAVMEYEIEHRQLKV